MTKLVSVKPMGSTVHAFVILLRSISIALLINGLVAAHLQNPFVIRL